MFPPCLITMHITQCEIITERGFSCSWRNVLLHGQKQDKSTTAIDWAIRFYRKTPDAATKLNTHTSLRNNFQWYGAHLLTSTPIWKIVFWVVVCFFLVSHNCHRFSLSAPAEYLLQCVKGTIAFWKSLALPHLWYFASKKLFHFLSHIVTQYEAVS